MLGGSDRPTALVKAEPGAAKPAKKRISILVRSMPWKQALDWLGNETGMPVIAGPLPEGDFNAFGPSREYTIPELVDLFNNQLKVNAKNPCLLVRSNTSFQLIPYDLKNPNPDLTNLPRVTEKDLDQHGDTELVILEISFDALPAKEVVQELNPSPNKGIMGPLGRVIAIPNSNQLILRDTVQNLKNIVSMLREADEVEKKKGEIYKYKCIYVKAEIAEGILKDVLGIVSHNQPAAQPGQPGQPVPPQVAQAPNAQKDAVRVSSDKISNTVFVTGPLAKILIAKKTVEELEEANKGQPPIVAGPPIVKTYKIPGGNAKEVAKALKDLYASRSVTVSPIGNDAIMVLANPEDQDAIRKYIEGAKDQTDFKAIQLYQLDAKKVFDNLTNLFNVKDSPAPALDFDASGNRILVRGTTEQVEAVKHVLKQLGEQDVSGQGNIDQIVITVEKGSATALAEALTIMVPQRRQNPVVWVRIRRPGLGSSGESKESANGNGTENGTGAALAQNDPPAPKANSSLPGSENAPIFLSAVGTKLKATCKDPDALQLIRELYRLLQTPAGEGDYDVIKLKYARAADAAKTLDMAFNGTKPDNNRNRSPWWFDDYRRPEKEKEPRLRVVPDSNVNSLWVQANPLDMILVHKLVKDTIDVSNLDSNAIIQNHLIPLKYADVVDVEWAIKDVYREHLNNTLSAVQSGAYRNSFYGATNLNTDANGNARPVDLTVTSVLGTNTLIVGCPKMIYEDIEKLAKQLDEAAKDSRKVWMAVPIKGIDPLLIQQAA